MPSQENAVFSVCMSHERRSVIRQWKHSIPDSGSGTIALAQESI